MSSSQSLSSYEILPSATRLVNLEEVFFLFCKGWNTTQLLRQREGIFLHPDILRHEERCWKPRFLIWPSSLELLNVKIPDSEKLSARGRQNYHSLHSQLRVLTGLVTSSSTAQLLFLLLFLLPHRQLGTRSGWDFCFPPNEVRVPDQMLRAACFYVQKSDSTPGLVPGRDIIKFDSCISNC